jgi:hypothetical protein
MRYLRLDERLQLRRRLFVLSTRIVDIYDARGAHIAAYTVCLEEQGCLESEFEEVALIFVERSGRVAKEQVSGLIARCHRDN